MAHKGPASFKRGKKVSHIGPYEIGRTLGEGSFSKVKLATDVFTGKKFAIKIVDWSLVEDLDDQTECVDREIKIMKLLDHPNIVKLYDIITHRDDKQTFLVLEYVARGELFDYIVANGRIREPESRKFWRQLISAIEYCHAFLVVHRDLKPSNLLLDDDGSIKITDFGLSNTMTPGKLFTTWCGSLYYSAPEIVEEKKYVGPAVDVWSCGVILYALLNGRLPWSGKCLARDTPVLMHSGSFKPVQHVRVGERIMGDDGTPRLVLSLARGAEPMARVELRDGGDSFTCNVSHVLALKAPRFPSRVAHRVSFLVALRNADGTVASLRAATHAMHNAAAAKQLIAEARAAAASTAATEQRAQLKRRLASLLGARGAEDVVLCDEPIDIAVKDLLDAKKVDGALRNALRAYRVGTLQFAERAVPLAVEPYALAYLLGAGARVTAPDVVEFYASQQTATNYFAPYAASLGAKVREIGHHRWSLVGVGAALVEAVSRRSLNVEYRLGSEATRRALLAGAVDSQLLRRQRHNKTLVAEVLFVARSLGVRVRRQRKDCAADVVLDAGAAARCERFDVTLLPPAPYYGFTLDGNRRFVVGDGMIVTHNTDLEKIRQIVVADIAPADRDLSDGCLDLIYGCCTVDVKDRLTIPQIRMHPWTNEGYDGPPPCNVPQTMPVDKVSDPVLQQLVFLGILDDSVDAHEQARADIMANKQTQIVYAYHALLGKPQLLVSASFLPRDKIKRAISAARTEADKVAAAGTSGLATKVAGPAEDDDEEDSSSQSPAPPKTPAPAVAAPKLPPAPAQVVVTPPPAPPSSTAADLQDLSDILGEIDAQQHQQQQKQQQPAVAPALKQRQDAQAAVDALMGDLDALSATVGTGAKPAAPVTTTSPHKQSPLSVKSSSPPAAPAAPSSKATSPPTKKKSAVDNVEAVETRRRSRTVSSGSGNAKPLKMADMLKSRLGASKPPKPTVDTSSAPAPITASSSSSSTASSAPSSPVPNPAAAAAPRSHAAAVAARDVQTRQRSMSLGQRSAPKPPAPPLIATVGEASTSSSALLTTPAAAPTSAAPEKASGSSTWAANLFKRKSLKKKLDDTSAIGSSSASTASTGVPPAVAAAAAAASSSSSSSASTAKTAGSTWDPSLFAKAKANAAEVQVTDEMRTVKGVFKCATTSTRPPLELVAAIEQALGALGTLKFKRKSQYLFRCADKKSKVRLEIEVVNIEKLDRMHGIRFARLQGDTFVYKKLAEEIMSAISGSV